MAMPPVATMWVKTMPGKPHDAEEARAGAVERRKRAQQPQVLDEHIGDGDQDHGAQRGHGRDPLGRSGYDAARIHIERNKNFAVGQSQQLAGVVNIAGMVAKPFDSPSQFAPSGIERGQSQRRPALAFAIAFLECRRDLALETIETSQAQEADQFAQHDHHSSKSGDQQQHECGRANPVVTRERSRDKTREPGGQPRGSRSPKSCQE